MYGARNVGSYFEELVWIYAQEHAVQSWVRQFVREPWRESFGCAFGDMVMLVCCCQMGYFYEVFDILRTHLIPNTREAFSPRVYDDNEIRILNRIVR